MATIGGPSLEVTMAGVKFRSPFGVGAVGVPFGKPYNCTPELHAQVLLKHAEEGAAYIMIPTCCYTTDETKAKIKKAAKKEPRPEMYPLGDKTMNLRTPVAPYGQEGIYIFYAPMWNEPEDAEFVSALAQETTQIVKAKKPADVRIVANIIGYGDLPDSWVDACKKWEELGADIIEMNFGCPSGYWFKDAEEDFFQKRFGARFLGGLVGQHADIVENAVRACVKAVKIPVGIKLSPELGFPRLLEVARRIRDAGGKWVSTTNMPLTIAPPDIYNRGKPLWPFLDGNPLVAACGAFMRPNTYKYVATIARFVPGIDISATGGLVTPEQAVEAMMLGARQVQVATGIMEQGRLLLRRSNTFLKKFMVDQGYKSVDEMIGLGQQYIKYNDEIDCKVGHVHAVVDKTKCKGCGHCADALCYCMHMENKKAVVDEENCAGCGSCMVACQHGAVHMEWID